MNLLPCAACSKPISPEAIFCPQCGHPAKSRSHFGFEWKSQAEFGGWPLVHVAIGQDSKTGKRLIARGIIAIGQFGVGLITIAQFGVGILFGVGQFMFGLIAIAQFAVALQFGIGQIATGVTAIGQIALGKNVTAQVDILKSGKNHNDKLRHYQEIQ